MNFKKFLLFFIAAFIIAGGALYVRYKSDFSFPIITSYTQVLGELTAANANTLILFDIDDTLINPTDIISRFYTVPAFFKLKALFKYPQLRNRDAVEHYYSIMWGQGDWFVIEPYMVQVIKNLIQRGCMVLGLTAIETGKFGVIDDFPQWRFDVLKNLGIEFDQRFGNVLFTNLPKYREDYPELYNGILCTNRQPKGKVLNAFLDYFNLHPAKIFFFDDQKQNLDSVAQICQNRNIPYKIFQYDGEQWQSGTWDECRAWLQLDHLIAHDEWLSDKVADQMVLPVIQK